MNAIHSSNPTVAVVHGAGSAAAAAPAGPDPTTLLRSRRYVVLLVLAGLIGVPVSAAAYWFLVLVSDLQKWVYTDLPSGVGYSTVPSWWPIPILAIGGLLVAVTIRYLPGHGGESPADGFHAGGAVESSALPGIALAALLTLACGAVLGPEGPLIALGGGSAAFVVRLVKRDAPADGLKIIAAAGSFAAISTLLGSPLLGAFLLMEASGLGGATLGLVLLPGLLAAGVGSLIFVGLDSWTGHGTFSLAIPNLPHAAPPNVAEFGWALVIGLLAALVALAIRTFALTVRPVVEKRSFLLAPAAGVVIAALAILYGEVTSKNSSEVLFSGQVALPALITGAAGYSVGALLLLLLCKSLAYSVSLASFRGGPVFPAIFIGAAGGIAMSHLPGLSLAAATAMGIGAMCVAMLRLPLTSVLLATVLLLSDGAAVMPLVIVAVVVAHVATAQLAGRLRPPVHQPEAGSQPLRSE